MRGGEAKGLAKLYTGEFATRPQSIPASPLFPAPTGASPSCSCALLVRSPLISDSGRRTTLASRRHNYLRHSCSPPSIIASATPSLPILTSRKRPAPSTGPGSAPGSAVESPTDGAPPAGRSLSTSSEVGTGSSSTSTMQSASPSTANVSVREGGGQGEAKRQAQGNASSPKPYVHKDSMHYLDSAMPSDHVLDAHTSTTHTSPDPIDGAARSSLPGAMAVAMASTGKITAATFAHPGAPQSARHQTTSPGMAKPALPPVQARTSSAGKSGSGSGSGSGGGSGGVAHSPQASRSQGSNTPNRFSNYSERPSERALYSFAMMDLDESLRALYFAPLPLIVLDATRNIKMLNRPAEVVLGIGGANCAGQRLERYVSPSSRSTYTLALNEASENFQTTSSGKSTPVSTRLRIEPVQGQSSIWADITISAWYPTDTLFNSSEVDRSMSGRETTDMSPKAPSPSSETLTRSSSISEPTPTSMHAPHEALFTISFVPCRSGERGPSPSEGKTSVEDILRESVLHHLDTAVMALSKDGKTLVRNKAADEVMSIFERAEPKVNAAPTAEAKEQSGIDFSWIYEMMDCYDENFEKPFLESDWPIYRCVVLGQATPPVAMGVESKSTGERTVLEITGKPMKDNAGYGEHIGGIVTLRNITAERRKLKEEVVEQGDLYFKQTCDAMPQLVWVTSPSGYHEWYSKSWYEYTGSSSLESRGVGWQSYFHEEDMPEAGRRWSHSLRTGELYETAYRCKRHDGAWRWFLGRALPMRDRETGTILKWFGTCTDIHDQVEALSASRRAQSQLESVINHAAMTLWAVDRQGTITVAEGPGVRQLKLAAPGTPGSERELNGIQTVTGYSRSEHGSEGHSASNSTSGHSSKRSMVGRSIYSIWDSTNIRDSMARALQGEMVVEDMEVDGRWFRTSYTPLRAQQNEVNNLMDTVDKDGDEDMGEGEGEIIGVVGASMDISDRKKAQERMEESLLEKTRALAAEGAAREASRLKSEFLANMSHEIRTPIAGVIGLSELLLDEKGLSPQHRDYAETIQRSAEGLLTVINDVLDFSKVEIGKLDVEQAPFNLEVLLLDAKRMLSFATQKKGLDFRDSVELTYKGKLIGDVGRLRQVITNLLTNAIKFTARGYISLEVAELSENDNNLLVRFDVRDTGCGISVDSLSRLFQPFSQADPSTARRFGGTGLGLSISKNLVELMNGEIGLNSVEGQGSHAWFVIPFRKATLQEDEQRSRMIEANIESPVSSAGFATGGMPVLENHSLARPRKDIWILIAEDNIVNAQIAFKNIKKMGFSCRTAENGLLALEELNRNSYDAVLMDCQMPECDGYEATRMIRKSHNPDIRILPVIALTASAIKGDRERALEAGMVDYLAKPVKRPALESTLCKWLFDSDARQSLARFFSTTAPTSPKTASHGANIWPAAVVDPTAQVGTITWNESVQVSGGTETMSLGMDGKDYSQARNAQGQAAQRTQEAQLVAALQKHAQTAKDEYEAATRATSKPRPRRTSPSSLHNEAVLESVKASGLSSIKHGSDLFLNGDALSAAAVLLSARRSSAEDAIKSPFNGVHEVRPSMSPRSRSHGTASTNSVPSTTSASSVSIPSAKATIKPSKPAWNRTQSTGGRSDMFRRSSREQAGLGRDLDGEVFQATFAAEPRLGPALRSEESLADKSKAIREEADA